MGKQHPISVKHSELNTRLPGEGNRREKKCNSVIVAHGSFGRLWFYPGSSGRRPSTILQASRAVYGKIGAWIFYTVEESGWLE